MLRISFLLCFLWCVGCTSGAEPGLTDDQLLTHELADRQAADSLIQDYFSQHINELPLADLIFSRDSVFTENCHRLQELFAERGLLKTREVGRAGVHNFWVMVQHCDVDPKFQEEVLRAMQRDSAYQHSTYRKEMAYLTDRVLKNTGRAQRYGTQLKHGDNLGLELPLLEDTCGVDRLRKEAGMEPLTEYYNNYLAWHFSANSEVYAERKISEPLKFTLPADCPPSSLE